MSWKEHGVFVKLQKSPTSQRVQVYLMESYRDVNGKPQNRIVERVGELGELQAREPGILQRLRSEAEAVTSNQKRTRLVEVDLGRDRTGQDHQVCYGQFFVEGIWKALGMPALLHRLAKETGTGIDVGRVAQMLVTGRMLSPASKLATWNTRDQWFDPFDCQLQDVYNTLTLLDSWSWRVQAHVHRQVGKTMGRDVSLVFYDVTNYWFETDDEDGFRMVGASKENRKDPIVAMGLLIDSAGIPIAYRLFRGNMHDAKTLIPVLDELRTRYGLGRIVVVADKGLNGKTNLAALNGNHDGWIVSQKVRGRVAKDITNCVEDPTGWVGDEQSLLVKSYLRDRVLNGVTITEKVVITWSRAHAARDRAKREKLRTGVEQLLQHPGSYNSSNKYGRKRYIHETLVTPDGEIAGKHLSFDQDRWEADEARDGFYAIITSETTMTDEDIINHYKGLARIEESFKVIKSDFEGRPVHVRTQSHINAHFLTCFLALVITRLIQHGTSWEITASQTKQALTTATCTPLEHGLWTIDETTNDYKTIETAWGVSLPNRYTPIETIRQYKRAIINNTPRTLQTHNKQPSA